MARSDDWPAFLRALEQAALAAWPEVLETAGGGGVWETTETKRESYEALGWPRVVLEILPAHEADWGMVNTVFEQPVAVYYGDWTEEGRSTPFRSKLKGFQNQVQTFGLTDSVSGTSFTVLPRWGIHVYQPGERWDQSANDILYTRNNMAQAGGIVLTLLVGDNAG